VWCRLLTVEPRELDSKLCGVASELVSGNQGVQRCRVRWGYRPAGDERDAASVNKSSVLWLGCRPDDGTHGFTIWIFFNSAVRPVIGASDEKSFPVFH
jgi:hypothetical protein